MIEVNGYNYTVEIKNGVAKLVVALPIGKYNATAYYYGDNKFNATTGKFQDTSVASIWSSNSIQLDSTSLEAMAAHFLGPPHTLLWGSMRFSLSL